MNKTWTVLIFCLVFVTATLGHEGHHKNNQTSTPEVKNVTQGQNQTLKTPIDHPVAEEGSDEASAEYDDDGAQPVKLDPDYPVDDPTVYASGSDPKNADHDPRVNSSAQSQAPEQVLENITTDEPSPGETTEENPASTTEEADSSGSTSIGPSLSTTTGQSDGTKSSTSSTTPVVPTSTSSSSPVPTTTTTLKISSSAPTTEDDTGPTTTDEQTTLKASPSPLPISTQDYGDISNNTTPKLGDVPGGGKSSGMRTWAVVLVSILVSFGLIFTILYFIRGTIIKRRKDDQRRLLRASISSEGFFHGDGEVGGKFEL